MTSTATAAPAHAETFLPSLRGSRTPLNLRSRLRSISPRSLCRHPACVFAKHPVVGHLYPSVVPEAWWLHRTSHLYGRGALTRVDRHRPVALPALDALNESSIEPSIDSSIPLDCIEDFSIILNPCDDMDCLIWLPGLATRPDAPICNGAVNRGSPPLPPSSPVNSRLHMHNNPHAHAEVCVCYPLSCHVDLQS
jgi:hypothetical protein